MQNKLFETIAITALKDAENDKVRNQIRQIKVEVETMAYNLEHSKNANIRTNDAVNGLYNTLNSFFLLGPQSPFCNNANNKV